MSKLQKPLTPYELVMRNLRHLSHEEKVTVAKFLALECGVELWSKQEALQAFQRVVERAKQQVQPSIAIPEIIKHG